MPNPEISCNNCTAACCKGNPFMIMQLSKKEFKFMKRGGSQFQTILTPVNYDREDARYPIGADINTQTGTIRWMYERSRQTEPLPAGMGRYALVGACQYLETDENGWEHCGVYDTRPQACQDFQMGSPKCQIIREKADVPVPVDIRPRST